MDCFSGKEDHISRREMIKMAEKKISVLRTISVGEAKLNPFQEERN